MILYVFASYTPFPFRPGRVLSAGGIRRVIETEELGALVHGDTMLFKRHVPQYHLSERVRVLGITWRWFPEHTAFPRGVSRRVETPRYKWRTVVEGTDLTQDQYLRAHGATRVADLRLVRLPVMDEGRREYEARWEPGTCPQFEHAVNLTNVL